MARSQLLGVYAGVTAAIPDNKFYVAAAGDDEDTGLLGHPWKTITKVNAYSSYPADSVIAFNGGETFAGKLSLAQSGTSGHPITITSYGTGRATIDASTDETNAFNSNGRNYIKLYNINLAGGSTYATMINTVGIELRSMNIVGDDTTHANGISLFTGAEDIVIDDVVITDYLCVDSGGAGIYASAVDGMTITNCDISGCGQDIYDHGIYLTGCNDVTIQGVNSHENTGHGIQVQDYCTNCYADANWCHDNGYYGIFAGILDEDNGCEITNNIVDGNTNTGIFAGTTAPDLLIAFNTIVNNGASGTGNGLHIGEHGCTVKNNIIVQDYSVVGNCRPLRFQDDDALAGGAVFDNNLYLYTSTTDWSAGTVKMVARTSAAAGYTFAEWQARAEAPDANGVYGDPVFETDYTDLHLDTGSPAIGEGVAIEGIDYDYDGVARGTPPDIGALEYVA